MPKTERKPKDLLADQELVGFTRRKGSDHQVVQRASSAKVYLKSLQREDAEQTAVSYPPRPAED